LFNYDSRSNLKSELENLSLQEYYQALLSELSNYFGYSKTETDSLMRYKFLFQNEMIENQDVIYNPELSGLSESEFVAYLDKIKQWAQSYGFSFED
jgi:hypothetical protein